MSDKSPDFASGNPTNPEIKQRDSADLRVVIDRLFEARDVEIEGIEIRYTIDEYVQDSAVPKEETITITHEDHKWGSTSVTFYKGSCKGQANSDYDISITTEYPYDSLFEGGPHLVTVSVKDEGLEVEKFFWHKKDHRELIERADSSKDYAELCNLITVTSRADEILAEASRDLRVLPHMVEFGMPPLWENLQN